LTRNEIPVIAYIKIRETKFLVQDNGTLSRNVKLVFSEKFQSSNKWIPYKSINIKFGKSKLMEIKEEKLFPSKKKRICKKSGKGLKHERKAAKNDKLTFVILTMLTGLFVGMYVCVYVKERALCFFSPHCFYL
jgi:hypothetical protein